MKKILTLIFALTTTISFIVAGPFGLEFGWTIDDLRESGLQLIYPEEERILNEYEWRTEKKDYARNIGPIDIIPPEPSDLFQFYSIEISAEFGLCKIEAYTGSSIVYKDHEPVGNQDNFAIRISRAREIFDRTNNALFIKYGEGRNFLYNENNKFWDWENNSEHVDIELELGESMTFDSIGDFPATLDYDTLVQRRNGLYYVRLEYDQSEYLQAVKEAELL